MKDNNQLKTEILCLLMEHGTGDQIRFFNTLLNGSLEVEGAPSYDHSKEGITEAFMIDKNDLIDRLNDAMKKGDEYSEAHEGQGKNSIIWANFVYPVIKTPEEKSYLMFMGVEMMKRLSRGPDIGDLIARLYKSKRREEDDE